MKPLKHFFYSWKKRKNEFLQLFGVLLTFFLTQQFQDDFDEQRFTTIQNSNKTILVNFSKNIQEQTKKSSTGFQLPLLYI